MLPLKDYTGENYLKLFFLIFSGLQVVMKTYKNINLR